MIHQKELSDIALQAKEKTFRSMEEPVDVIVSTDALHVGYLGGYRSVLLDADRTYKVAVVATREKTLLVTGASDGAAALEVYRDPGSIYRYGSFFVETFEAGRGYDAMPPTCETFMEALAAACKAVLREGNVVGLDATDEDGASRLSTMLSTYECKNVRGNLIRSRSTKLPGEIAKLRYISELAERGMQRALAEARPGMTELELSTIISSEIIAGGGIPRFIVVTAGERSALVDAYATNKRMEKGELLRLDIGCTVNGYWADTARTAIFGEPTREQSERYKALQEGEAAQLAIAKAGVSASELYRVAIETVRKRNALSHFKRNHCGHGIGLSGHEFPSLAPGNETVIVKDMVLCVETPYYELGWGGMMVEDTIVITEAGYDPLTNSDRQLRIL